MIQRSVQDPLAEMILAGDVKDGDHVEIGTKGNVLTFNGTPAAGTEIEEFDVPAKRMLN